MIETKEFCDCCGVELNLWGNGTTLYRKRVKRYRKRFWPPNASQEEEWQVLCHLCWSEIGNMIKQLRQSNKGEKNGS